MLCPHSTEGPPTCPHTLPLMGAWLTDILALELLRVLMGPAYLLVVLLTDTGRVPSLAVLALMMVPAVSEAKPQEAGSSTVPCPVSVPAAPAVTARRRASLCCSFAARACWAALSSVRCRDCTMVARSRLRRCASSRSLRILQAEADRVHGVLALRHCKLSSLQGGLALGVQHVLPHPAGMHPFHDVGTALCWNVKLPSSRSLCTLHARVAARDLSSPDSVSRAVGLPSPRTMACQAGVLGA